MPSENSTHIGRQAEQQVSAHLTGSGHTVKAQNWRTKSCEIDIVSQKNGVMFFTEVKYRRNAKYGFGVDAVTSSKLKQMEYAASIWVSHNNWLGDYRLQVADVGNDGSIEVLEVN